MNPAQRKLKLEEGWRACRAGDSATAERICQTLLRASKADAQALHMLGVIAASRQDYATATAHFARSVAINPGSALFHNDLARVHALAGRYELALASLERAVKLQPGDVRATTDLADVLERSGRHERAWQLLQPFVQAGNVGDDMAPVVMRLLDHAGKTEEAITLARQRLAVPSNDDTTRRFLLQLLGRLCEKTGDTRSAFHAFADAKQTEPHRFVPADYSRHVDGLIHSFSAEAMPRLPRASQRSELPVFIACMPRSGSTLVEQVIHAHPAAFGGGEDDLLHKAIVGLPALLGTTLPYPWCAAALTQAAVDRIAG